MLDQDAKDGSKGRPQSLSLGKVAVVLWMLLVAFLAYPRLVPEDAPLPSTAPLRAAVSVSPPTVVPGAEEALAALVAERTAELGLKPKTAITPSDRALEEAIAIKNGDYAKARHILEEVLGRSRLQSWRFYPFNEFIGTVVRGDAPVLLEHLNNWLKQEPKATGVYLIRAAYYREASKG